ncbi:MAG: 3-dehydroquinate synthase [Clostridiaceae bacterium]
MFELKIELKNKSYPIYITTDYEFLGDSLKIANINEGSKVVVITDENVNKYQSEKCIKSLKKNGYEIYKYIIEPGEKSKSIETVKNIFTFLISLKLDRNSSIVALGGGCVGDVAGFVAATFLRGINFIQIPTSMIAQVDSSVGGKVGINFNEIKNVIGAFYQPEFVYINVNAIKTLPSRQIKSGLAEIIIHGLIKDEEFFHYIICNLNKIYEFDEEVIKYCIMKNCSIKGSVVKNDEKDKGERAVLNLGHTIGHAVEAASNFTLSHGESISIGTIAAFKIAYYLNMIKYEDLDIVTSAFKSVGLPVSINGLNKETVFKNLFYDKKIRDNKLVFILPVKIGKVKICEIEDIGLLKRVISEIVFD